MVPAPTGGAASGAGGAKPPTGGTGTGGSPVIATGGRPSVGTGGAPSVGTGGAPSVGTGGAPSVGTGGAPSAGTGGAGGRPAGGAGGMAAGGSGGAGGGGAASTAPKFSEIYMSIIMPTCAGCHAATQPMMNTKDAAFMNLTTTMGSGMCSSMKRVTANMPAMSVLVMALKAEGCRMNRPMPPAGARVSADNIAKIEAWIMAGAMNN